MIACEPSFDIYKKGSKYGFLHRRFVEITATSLVVKKNRRSKAVEREIPLNCETLVTEDSENDVTLRPINEKPITFSFKLSADKRRFSDEMKKRILTTEFLSIDCFDRILDLGKGYYGDVFLARRRNTREFFAIKSIPKIRLLKENMVGAAQAECQILKKCEHPFIVKIGFAFTSQNNIYFGLEFIAGGTLLQRMLAHVFMPLNEVKFYLAEIAIALNYLHKNRIVYRDLKGENVLIDKTGHIKLTDFGLSKMFKDNESCTTLTFCGTPSCIPPEIIKREPYTFSVDWWMLGVLAFEMIFGQEPFKHPNKLKLFEIICSKDPIFPSSFFKDGDGDKDSDNNVIYSNSGKRYSEVTNTEIEFIKGLLEKNHEKRMTFEEIKNHNFFNGLNFDDLEQLRVKPPYIPPSDKIQRGERKGFIDMLDKLEDGSTEENDADNDPYHADDFEFNSNAQSCTDDSCNSSYSSFIFENLPKIQL